MIIQKIMEISKMFAKYNNDNKETEKPFIETNEHLSHENFGRIIQKNSLTDDIVALFLDLLNLNLNQSHQINDQARIFCIGSYGYSKICYYVCDEYGAYLVLPFLEEVPCPGPFLMYTESFFLDELELDLNGGEGD